MQNVTLYYREGGSDKVYQASVEPKDGLFVVNFAYGRRGSTLNTGTKTAKPVEQAAAVKLFEKLVSEKKAKGYSEGPDGTPYQFTDKAARVSGYLPQLLNAIEESGLETFLADPNWCMQEKLDGKRMMLVVQGAAIHGINRKGLLCGLPSPVVVQAKKLGRDMVLDGECVGESFHAFDLLSLGGQDLRPLPYRERLEKLARFAEPCIARSIRIVITCLSQKDKREHLSLLQEVQREGVVFKRLDAPYTAGRPASGGTQVKHKFYATAFFIVAAVNESKRSVSLRLFNENRPVAAGNVTIPPNHEIPEAGEIIECRFLYAFRESGSVYQPTYLGRREDVDPNDCTVSQLKYRASVDQEDETGQ